MIELGRDSIAAGDASVVDVGSRELQAAFHALDAELYKLQTDYVALDTEVRMLRKALSRVAILLAVMSVTVTVYLLLM